MRAGSTGWPQSRAQKTDLAHEEGRMRKGGGPPRSPTG